MHPIVTVHSSETPCTPNMSRPLVSDLPPLLVFFPPLPFCPLFSLIIFSVQFFMLPSFLFVCYLLLPFAFLYMFFSSSLPLVFSFIIFSVPFCFFILSFLPLILVFHFLLRTICFLYYPPFFLYIISLTSLYHFFFF